MNNCGDHGTNNEFFLITILLGAILIALNPVSAATYHVYPTDPIISVTSTISSAPAGSTIYVHSGTYVGPAPPIIINNSNITIIGDDPSTTIFDGIAPIFVSSASISGITIKNLTTSGIWFNGVDINGVNIQNCIVQSTTEGIILSSMAITNVVIENCLVYGGSMAGIGIYGTSVTNTLIRNCTLHQNQVGIQVSGLNINATIENCIITKNTVYGIHITTPAASSTVNVKNSNSWGNGINTYFPIGPSSTLTLVNNISADPQYVDGLNTFYLSLLSPSVNSGSASSATLGLYDGFTTRTDDKWDTGIVDMGFHYTSNRGPPPTLPIAKILEIVKKNQED